MDSTVSGLYQDLSTGKEFRLDVDGHFPLRVASGTFTSFFSSIHWIADLSPIDSLSWEGGISYKNPNDVSFPYSTVGIDVTDSGCSFKYYTDRYSDFLATHGESNQATIMQYELRKTLSKRGVIKSVLDRCREREKSYKAKK